MHSPEPWKMHERTPNVAVDSGKNIVLFAYPIDMDNAARIVACVNAMKDVPDPAALVAAVKEVIHEHYAGKLLDYMKEVVIARKLAEHINMELPT